MTRLTVESLSTKSLVLHTSREMNKNKLCSNYYTTVLNTKQNNLYDPVEPETLTDFDDVPKDNKLHIFHSLGFGTDSYLRSIVMSYVRETGYGLQLVMNNKGAYYRTGNPAMSDWRNLYDGLYTYNYNTTTFDFNNPDYAPGLYRLGAPENILNAPVSTAAYGNVLVAKCHNADTLAMLIFPYHSFDPKDPYLVCKCTRKSLWETVGWFKIEGTPI